MGRASGRHASAESYRHPERHGRSTVCPYPPRPALLTLSFLSEASVERGKIDHRSGMRSIADLFHLVARRNLELNSLSIDLDHLGFGTNFVTRRRSGKMPYIYCRTNRALTEIQKWPDSIKGG